MSDNFERGDRVRREVLGDEYVDRSHGSATDFTRSWQRLVTEFAWGAVWAGDELDRKTRSLLTVVILAALGRQHELQLHLRGAVSNGCTPDEIRGALLHVAVYAGFPAALTAFRLASEVLAEGEAG
jgi:4-carboxymuconolactone decarboxylase